MRRRNFLKTSLGAAGAALTLHSMPPPLTTRGAVTSAPGPAAPPDASYSSLRQAFENPPNDNRNWTRWWWFGPQATEQGIAYELEQMHKQGLGGVEVQWMTPLEPEGNFAFLSERWAQLVKFTVQKAKDLGMRVDFTLGTGWPYGGPWIPVELGSQCLLLTVEEELGPNGFGVRIPGELGDHEKLIGLFAAQTLGSDEALNPDSIHDLRPYLRYSDPNFWAVVRPPVGWPVPTGKWKVISLKQVPTRQPVRSAALGAEGLVLNHLSRQALNRHLEVVGGALKKVAGDEFGKTVRAVFCDSFEISLPHRSLYWTDGFQEEFKRRKAYDITPHLLALCFNVGDETPHIRHDFLHVLSQLIMENFFIPLREWCEQNNLKSRVQSHGSVGELLQAYAENSIGEGEQVTSGEPRISVHRKYATSAAHIYQKPLVSAESFTFLTAPGYPASYRYMVNLELMKSVLDPGLRDGYQEIINHGYSYNDPDEETEPFIEMYASAVIRHTEPWWQYYHYFTSYLARCCSLLCQGHFVGDIAILSPIPDAWSKSSVPKELFWTAEATIKWGDLPALLVRSGNDFNFVNDQVLLETSNIENGKLVIGRMEHAALILPNVTYLSLKTMERVREFCRSGGLVIATQRLPEFSAGFTGFVENDRQLRGIVQEMFSDIPEKEQVVRRRFGEGEAILLRSLSELPGLLRSRFQPDFDLEKRSEAVMHLHRRVEEADVYFVTNNSESYQENAAVFRVGRRIPELWNAESGGVETAPVYSIENAGVRIPFRLKPFESVFYVFRDAPEPAHAIETNADEIVSSAGNKVRCLHSSNGVCYIRTGGSARKAGRQEAVINGLPAPFEITGEWQVTFQAYKFPKLVKKMPALHSWTDDPDSRSFSGTARYELEFEVPPDLLGKERRVMLDLGVVADASKVRLNSQAAGVTWKRPHQHDVTQWVHPGKNFLEVRVSNRLINLVGGLKRPAWADEVVEKYGNYNERREWYETNSREYGATDLPPAGLLGPVKLVFFQQVEFEI